MRPLTEEYATATLTVAVIQIAPRHPHDMKPLANITVVDLTVNVPGPFASMVLCDLGAAVTKVEPPGGDPLRHSPGMFGSLNRGKQSISLDLKATGADDVLRRLCTTADIVLEGWRPGVARRLKADYPTLAAANTGLVYCSISGFGQEGPWSERAGHDVNYLALSGYLGVQSAVEGRPWPPPVLVSDLASGLHAAIAVLAAINGRHSSGTGTYIDLSMTESALSLLGLEIGRLGEGGTDGQPNVTSIPHYGLFPCKEGGWLSLGIVHEDHFWRRLCQVAGLAGLAELAELADMKFSERLRRSEELRQRLHSTFLSQSAEEWERDLQEVDVPAAAVVELSTLFDSPQLKSRQAFVNVGADRYVAQPARFSTGEVAPTRGAPELGQHTEAVLQGLGYSPDETRSLRDRGVLGGTEGKAVQ